jgi:hypothetical protein
MKLINSKLFLNLDSFLNIDNFLSQEDNFYQLFSKKYRYSSPAWGAGSIALDTCHPYANQHQYLYHTYHNNEFDFNFTSSEKRIGQGADQEQWNEELSVYLQLKYNAVSPYRFLHFIDHSKNSAGSVSNFHDWVEKEYPEVFNWFKSFPMNSYKNVSLIFTPRYIQQGYHRDFNIYPIEKPETHNLTTPPDLNFDVVWLRFNLDRPFYLYDIDQTGAILHEYPVEGHSVMFNHYNWHGNIHPMESSSLTLKIEGKLNPEFKNKIFNE